MSEIPRHSVHRLIDKLLLGREMREVHILKDLPYKVFGRRHRVLLHDETSDLMCLLLYGPRGYVSSKLHNLADKYLDSEGRVKRKWRKTGGYR